MQQVAFTEVDTKRFVVEKNVESFFHNQVS
jgi:hypothetical protein